MTQPLDIHVDLGNGYAKHLFDGELDATHDIMRDFRHTQSIFQGDVDFNDNLLIDDPHLDALVALLWWQKHCLPIVQTRRGDAHYTITLAGRLCGDGMNSVGQNFNLTQWANAVLWLDSRCLWHGYIFSLLAKTSDDVLYSMTLSLVWPLNDYEDRNTVAVYHFRLAKTSTLCYTRMVLEGQFIGRIHQCQVVVKYVSASQCMAIMSASRSVARAAVLW